MVKEDGNSGSSSGSFLVCVDAIESVCPEAFISCTHELMRNAVIVYPLCHILLRVFVCMYVMLTTKPSNVMCLKFLFQGWNVSYCSISRLVLLSS